MREAILRFLSEHSHRYHTTSDLLESLQTETYASKDKDEKLRLRKKLLYHLNRLESNNKIQSRRETGNGEKHFAISKQEWDQHAIFQTSLLQSRPTEIKKGEREGWLTTSRNRRRTIEAAYINASKTTYKELKQYITTLSNYATDALCIDNVQNVTLHSTQSEYLEFLKLLQKTSQNKNCRVSIRFDLTKEYNEQYHLNALPRLVTNTLTTTYTTTPETHESIIANAVPHLAKTKGKLYIHNKNVSPNIFVGETGVYTTQNLTENPVKCLAHQSANLDVKKYLEKQQNSITDLRDFILRLAQYQLLTTAQLRSELTQQLHKRLDKPNKFYAQFLNENTDQIRLWNYTANRKNGEQDILYDLFLTTKQQIQQQTKKQLTIFQACGIPLSSNIDLKPCLGAGTPQPFSPRTYRKKTLSNLKQLGNTEWTSRLANRETTAYIFGNADRTRIFRDPEKRLDTLKLELKHLLRTYNIPLFCYDFASLRRDTTLENYYATQ